MALAALGREFQLCYKISQVKEKIQNGFPDLFILDIKLLDGYQVLTFARSFVGLVAALLCLCSQRMI